MWIEVFKAGTWTDASGKTREWSIHDIDRIIENYDAELNEAPLVLGHPEDDSPAYGWVEAIKRVGDTMLVKPKEMVEKFTNWVKDKHYKKVSIAINGDMTLRHVGFLGGTPPAVKGLKAPEFSLNEFSQYDIEAVELHEAPDIKTQEDNMSELKTLQDKLAAKEAELKELEGKFQEGDEEREKAIRELSAIRLRIV